jgi:phosphoglycolate phosphatase
MDDKFSGVMFDLDGTLLNTIDDLADSLNYALEKYGRKTHTPDEYKQFVGNGAIELVKRAVGADAPKDLFDGIYSAYNDKYASLRGNKTRPYDGVPELLDALAARGLPIGVMSNKPHVHTVATAERYFPGFRFLCVFGARDGVPLQPDPAGPCEFAAAAGLLTRDIAFVGDTGVDMQTAVNAGMYPVGALWGYRSRDELRDNGARALIASPAELAALLL